MNRFCPIQRFVDEFVVHHRDLAGGSAEGLQRDGEPGLGRLAQRDGVLRS